MRSDETAKKSLFHYAERAVFYMRQGQLGGLVYNSARNNVRTKITKLKRRFFVMRTRSKSKTSIELNSVRMRALNRMIASDYQARCYGGKITLIRSEQFSQNPNKDIGAQRWQQLTSKGLDIRTVPGGHISMFHEPYVGTLARELQECIDGACQNMPAVSNAA
jgi:thioesterase domain-containing protein